MRKFLKLVLSFALVFIFSLNASLLKDKNYGEAIVSEVISIYDADTFRVNIECLPELIGTRISIRVNCIDAPEIRCKCKTEKTDARFTKQFTVNALRGAKVIELKNMKRGKYFRIIADVFVDGKNLAKSLIMNSHARLYDGGKDGSWCN